MLTKLALVFVLHVIGLGVLYSRGLNIFRLHRLLALFAYFLLFYVAWGVIFGLAPALITPEVPAAAGF